MTTASNNQHGQDIYVDEHHNFESIYEQLSLPEKDILAKASQECFLIIGPEDEEEG